MDEAIKTAVTSLATELKGDVTEIFPIMLGVTGAVIAAGFVIKLVKKFAKIIYRFSIICLVERTIGLLQVLSSF